MYFLPAIKYEEMKMKGTISDAKIRTKIVWSQGQTIDKKIRTKDVAKNSGTSGLRKVGLV